MDPTYRMMVLKHHDASSKVLNNLYSGDNKIRLYSSVPNDEQATAAYKKAKERLTKVRIQNYFRQIFARSIIRIIERT